MIAFQSKGVLQSFTAATSAPTSVNVKPIAGLQNSQVMLTNTSTSIDAVIGWGTTDALAKANAVSGASAQQYYLLRGTQVVITATGPFFTGITASSTAVIEIQPGAGN